MAMTLNEVFYGVRVPVYLAHYGRQLPSSAAYLNAGAVPECQIRRMELSTFDLMVPMCCVRCESQVQEALLALGGVRDVRCDAHSQRVTVTGCLDPAEALWRARRMNKGAKVWSSSYNSHRHEVSSHQVPRRHIQQDNSRSNVGREQRSQPGQNSNPSSSDGYTRSLCPAYRDSTETHYISVNPTIATREESDC